MTMAVLEMDMPGATGDLSAMAQELALSRQTIEQSFLDLGKRLLDSSRLLRDITAAQEGMPAELQSEDFANAVALLHRLREEARRIASHQDDAGARVVRMMAMARALDGPIDSLNKSVRNLGLIAINARIIAAGMSAGGGDFDSFALEMVELGRNAARIVGEFSRLHRKLIEALTPAVAASDQFRIKHRDTLSAISDRLVEQLAAIEEHKRNALADAAVSGRVAGQVTQRIGQAVSALQVGDITRQRLEHIEDALADLEGGNATAASGVLVLAIQEAQLAETRDDFVREVQAFATALRSLSDDAREALANSAAQSDALLAKGGTALAGMVEDLGAMTTVLADFEAMRARIDALRAEVAVSVRDMQRRMDDIASLEQTMRLLAINTSVRCSRLGEEGRALRVVAQEMRELAAYTVEAATTVTGGLEQSTAELGDIGGQDEDGSAQSLSTDAADAIRLLDAIVLRLSDHMATIARTGPRTSQLLQEAAQASAGQGRHALEWDHVAAKIGAARDLLGPPEGELSGELLTRIRGRYTMAAERLIHDELCAEAGHQAEGSPPADADGASVDDLLF
jgi:methyl-accepting chemotaxis protein